MPYSRNSFLVPLSRRLGLVFLALFFACAAQAEKSVLGVTFSAGSGKPAAPARVYIFPGQTLACAWESAADAAYKRPQTRYVWSCSGGRFLAGQSRTGLPQYARKVLGRRAIWTAPAHSQEVTLTCTPTDAPAAVSRSCAVTVLSATMTVRRAGALKPDPADSDHVKTLPADFTASVTVAAGAQPSAEHQADVQIAVTLPDGSPAVGVPIHVTGRIGSGGQGPNDPPNNVTATLTLGDGVTDAIGSVVYPAAFTSGNRTETTTIQADYGNGTGPKAAVSQVWNEAGGWDYDKSFDYDAAWPIAYTMAFNDENNFTIPITGHHLAFVTTTICGVEWNEAIGDYEPVIYSGADIKANGYEGAVVWGKVTENAGVYRTTQTVSSDYRSIVKKFPVDLVDDSVSFDVVDNDAYDAN